MPLRDAKHLRFERLLPCWKGGDGKCQGDVVAAHLSKTTDAGKAQKASDKYSNPLCWWHHAESHRVGEVTFWGGMDNIYKLKALQEELYAVTGDIFAAQRVSMKARKDLL